jgi:hypothetical protein
MGHSNYERPHFIMKNFNCAVNIHLEVVFHISDNLYLMHVNSFTGVVILYSGTLFSHRMESHRMSASMHVKLSLSDCHKLRRNRREYGNELYHLVTSFALTVGGSVTAQGNFCFYE